MELNNEIVASALGEMSVLEVLALTKELEVKWNVKAEPQVVAIYAAKEDNVKVVKDEFDVVLLSVPADKKISVIKAMRDVLSLGLLDAKQIVEGAMSAPKTLRESVSAEEADRVKTILTEAGAVMEVR